VKDVDRVLELIPVHPDKKSRITSSTCRSIKRQDLLMKLIRSFSLTFSLANQKGEHLHFLKLS